MQTKAFYQNAIEELGEVFDTMDTTGAVRRALSYRVVLRLREGLIEGGIPADLATRVAAAADIDVYPMAEAAEGFWPLVDKLVRLAVLTWETLVEDLGKHHAETAFGEWGKKLSLNIN